jgi:tripartite-type tricarboxylate transporter receptor subunit TctC
MFEPIGSSLEYIRAGKVRALAVTFATRTEVLPDIPTVGEFVPGYEASGWQGVGAPRNTPVEIINKLNEAINAAITDAKMKARIANLGGIVFASSPAECGTFIAAYTEKWAGQRSPLRKIQALGHPIESAALGLERRIAPVCNISALPPTADMSADIDFRR